MNRISRILTGIAVTALAIAFYLASSTPRAAPHCPGRFASRHGDRFWDGGFLPAVQGGEGVFPPSGKTDALHGLYSSGPLHGHAALPRQL